VRSVTVRWVLQSSPIQKSGFNVSAQEAAAAGFREQLAGLPPRSSHATADP